jgi:hypothetical protein
LPTTLGETLSDIPGALDRIFQTPPFLAVRERTKERPMGLKDPDGPHDSVSEQIRNVCDRVTGPFHRESPTSVLRPQHAHDADRVGPTVRRRQVRLREGADE